MFTGIIEACATVRELSRAGAGARLIVARPAPTWDVARGDSIAVSGCCLTATEITDAALAFDLSAETLARTWLGDLRSGRRVNLERALRLSDRLGGHVVYGHVDGVARVFEVRDMRDGGREVEFELAPELARYLISKGSIAIDGVSLTVVDPRGPRFCVALIPETLARTTLVDLERGARVHVEADAIGKWIERLLPQRSVTD